MKKFLIAFLILLLTVGVVWGKGVYYYAGETVTEDVTAPQFSSATIAADGETVTIAFDENLTGTENDTFDLDSDGVSGTDIVLTYSSGSGTSSLVFTAGETIQSTETCNLDFDGDADDFEDDSGNDLADFSDESVTNNSEEGGSDCPDYGTYLFAWDGLYAGGDNATEQCTACLDSGNSTVVGVNSGGTLAQGTWTHEDNDDKLSFAVDSDDIDHDAAAGITVWKEVMMEDVEGSTYLWKFYGGAADDFAKVYIDGTDVQIGRIDWETDAETIGTNAVTRDGITYVTMGYSWIVDEAGNDHAITVGDVWASGTDEEDGDLSAWNDDVESVILFGDVEDFCSADYTVSKFVVIGGYKAACPW